MSASRRRWLQGVGLGSLAQLFPGSAPAAEKPSVYERLGLTPNAVYGAKRRILRRIRLSGIEQVVDHMNRIRGGDLDAFDLRQQPTYFVEELRIANNSIFAMVEKFYLI